MSNLIGQQIAQYIIESTLGEGSIGVVYKAREEQTEHRVALRVVHEKLTNDAAFQRRFWDLTQTAVSWQHANILPVYEANFVQGTMFMAMSLVEGGSLTDKMRQWGEMKQPLALVDALNLVAQLADGVAYAQELGVLHHSITPNNVFIRRAPQGTGYLASTMLADFGIAHLLAPKQRGLESIPTNKLPYLSPERVLGEPVNGRSDLYALGVLLYQLVTGRLPYDIQSASDVEHKHLHTFPQSPQISRTNLPDHVSRIIMKTMAKQPEDRFQTGHELAMALRAASAQLHRNLMTAELDVINLQQRMNQGKLPRLYITHPYETTRILPLDQEELIIGRAHNNDIRLSDESISRRHIHLKFESGKLVVIDLNSTNGSFIEDNRLPAHKHQPWPAKRKLRIGSYVLRWE
jgi:serine/threonine protein kinase